MQILEFEARQFDRARSMLLDPLISGSHPPHGAYSDEIFSEEVTEYVGVAAQFGPAPPLDQVQDLLPINHQRRRRAL